MSFESRVSGSKSSLLPFFASSLLRAKPQILNPKNSPHAPNPQFLPSPNLTPRKHSSPTYRRRDSNPYSRRKRILNPPRLPFRHVGIRLGAYFYPRTSPHRQDPKIALGQFPQFRSELKAMSIRHQISDLRHPIPASPHPTPPFHSSPFKTNPQPSIASYP